jgi:S-adenosylmethionine hydrolase
VTATAITFLSDFGLQDDFVGTCHGVMAQIAPETRVIDVTHGIPPQAVLQGALVLRNATPFQPAGIHLAVVDPDVGGSRRAIAVETTDGRVFVGPDNGLLMLAADAIGVGAAHELSDERYRLPVVSHTFHARDVFAPAAAHLAAGVPLADFGPALDPATLVRLSVPEPEVGRAQIRVRVLIVDRFGNIATNARREHLDAVRLSTGDRVEVRLILDRYYARLARTFADTEPGELILYEDSYGLVTLAINRGDAARLTGIGTGDEFRLAVS